MATRTGWRVSSADRGLELEFTHVLDFMGRYVIRRVYITQLASFATVLRMPDLTIQDPNGTKKAIEYYAIVRFTPKDQAPFGAIYEIGYSGCRMVAVSPNLAETKDPIQILSRFDEGLEKGNEWQPTIWCGPTFDTSRK